MTYTFVIFLNVSLVLVSFLRMTDGGDKYSMITIFGYINLFSLINLRMLNHFFILSEIKMYYTVTLMFRDVLVVTYYFD